MVSINKGNNYFYSMSVPSGQVDVILPSGITFYNDFSFIGWTAKANPAYVLATSVCQHLSFFLITGISFDILTPKCMDG